MSLPAAIFFVNADGINDGIRATLMTQLFIDEALTDTDFDARVQVEPDYPDLIHLNGLRIMVLRQNFHDLTNRNLADVVMFVKQGMASIEKNNFGPPGLTFPVTRINMYELLRYVGSNQVVILPPTASPPPAFGLRGIVADELADSSGVHLPNPDNESNNPDFINRK
jgi:hypothetical protein